MADQINRTIEELVLLTKQGDSFAPNELYERTYWKSYYIAVQFLKDEDQAQDVAQDSFLKALNNLNQLKDPSKFEGWLNQITVNTSKNYLKKKQPILFSQLMSDEDPDGFMDFEDTREEFSPEASIDYSETKRLILEMINNLPDKQKTATYLYYMQDCSISQIASVMECSENTIKSRLNYARKNIEGQVLALEKKGTKLYCMPILPFLFWMFHDADFLSTLYGSGSASVAAKASVSAKAASHVGSGSVASGSSGVATGNIAYTVGSTAASTGAKAISMKVIAAAVAACVCVGGGAAAAVAIHSGSVETESVVETGTEALEPDQNIGVETSAHNRMNAITEDQLEALSSLYQAMERTDEENVIRLLRANFVNIYAAECLCDPDPYLIFNGENVVNELDGQNLVVRTRSYANSDIEKVFEMTVFFGGFKGGTPNGSILSCEYCYFSSSGEVSSSDIMYADYDMGVICGDTERQDWHYKGEDGSELYKAYTTIGNYDEEKKTGEFILTTTGDEAPDGFYRLDDKNGRFYSVWSVPSLVFHIKAEGDLREHDRQNEAANYFVDESGQYYFSKRELRQHILETRRLFWQYANFTHEDDTTNLLPDGGILLEDGSVFYEEEPNEDRETTEEEPSVEYDVNNLSEEQQNMLAPMDSIAITYGYNYNYDPSNSEYFWEAVFYMVNCYPFDLWDDQVYKYIPEYDAEYLCYPVDSATIEEFASALFADYSEIPSPSENYIIVEDDIYYMIAGDRGDEYGKICSWIEHPDGSCTVRTQVLDGSTDEVYHEFEFELVHNSYSDSLNNPRFLYSVSSAKQIN